MNPTLQLPRTIAFLFRSLTIFPEGALSQAILSMVNIRLNSVGFVRLKDCGSARGRVQSLTSLRQRSAPDNFERRDQGVHLRAVEYSIHALSVEIGIW